MDYKKTNAPLNTVTRDMIKLAEPTGNVYETVCIIAKRANQIAVEMKHELEKKLQEFASMSDTLEEVSENREQIENLTFLRETPETNADCNSGVYRKQNRMAPATQSKRRHRLISSTKKRAHTALFFYYPPPYSIRLKR